MHKIKLAVSACLLGQRVRYDGKEKTHALLVDFFMDQCADQIELVPFCPEVSIGLSVPRAKIQVVRGDDEQMRVLGVENHRLDYTGSLISYAEAFLRQNPDIDYYIVKSKSPSCGFQSTPLFKFQDKKKNIYQQIALTSGLFVHSLLLLNPELQIIEESQLNTEKDCLNLLKKIIS